MPAPHRPREANPIRASITMWVAALVVSGALVGSAAGGPLTGGHLEATDADRDGFADASEDLARSSPASSSDTPLARASAALLLALANASVATDAAVVAGWTLANATSEAADLAAGGAIAAASAEVRAAISDARARLAAAGEEAVLLLPPEERPAVEAALDVLDETLSNAGATADDALGTTAGLVGTGEEARRAVTDGGFAFARGTLRLAFASAGSTLLASFDTAGGAVAGAARFLYASEPVVGTIDDETGDGVPEGGFVDLDGDKARDPDRSEDVTARDSDRDGFPDRVEFLFSSDPNDPRSTPDDVDRDRWNTVLEFLSPRDPRNSLLAPFDPKRTPLDVDGDGFHNSEEDRNVNGLVDPPWETDPEDPDDHPRPLASFDSSPSLPTDLDVVAFHDTSDYSEPRAPPGGRIVAWFWDFGDGSMSDERHPTHRYDDDGRYTVRLTVRENHGATGAATRVLDVLNVPPEASYVVSSLPTHAAPSVGFNGSASDDADGTVVLWRWAFGDGTPPVARSVPTVTHDYAEPGTYSVTLTVEDDDGATAARTTEVVVPNLLPLPDFTVTPLDRPVLAADDRIRFADASADPVGPVVSWSWTFGDGEEASGSTIEHTYATSGAYTVTLTVTDSAGATASRSRAIVVFPVPTADFAYAPAEPDDLTDVAFEDRSSPAGSPLASWAWTFGDGAVSAERNPVHRFFDDGPYTVRLVVTDENGVASDPVSRVVTVANVAPTVSIGVAPGEHRTSAPVRFSSGESDLDGTIVSRLWTFGDGATSAAKDPNHTYPSDPSLESRSYLVRLRVVDDDGAEAEAEVTIVVLQDTDGDGVPDLRDADIDGDGWRNEDEARAGSDMRDRRSTPDDFDGDGVPNVVDVLGRAAGETAPERDPCFPSQDTEACRARGGAPDTDGDGFSDSLERRLGPAADPADPQRPVPASDDDGDRVPAYVEEQICSREATHEAVNSTQGYGGRCVNLTDYEPPRR